MSRRRKQPRRSTSTEAVPSVAPREPCPCGSGKRYKNCHGRQARAQALARVTRPFEGLAGETDLVAMREVVPAATAGLTLAAEVASDAPTTDVRVCTVLPLGAAGLVHSDGSVLVALQTTTSSGDASRDVAAALTLALEADPGSAVRLPGLPGPGPRLQDLLDPNAELQVRLHEGFDFWAGNGAAADPEVAASLEQANEAAVPTVRLASVTSAYYSDMGDVRYLRWVRPESEPRLLDALSRLRAAAADDLGPGTRLLGTFRADGLLVPVWELPNDRMADDLEDPAVGFDNRLTDALQSSEPLTAAERNARAALTNRQITLTH